MKDYYQAMADNHPRLTLVDEEYLENTEREEEVLDIEINNGARPVRVDAIITHEPGAHVPGYDSRQITRVEITAVRSARSIVDRDGQDITRFLKEIDALDLLEDYISEMSFSFLR